MRTVLRCQHCNAKQYLSIQPGVLWIQCPKCTKLTPAHKDMDPQEEPPKIIDNPALFGR